MKTSSKSDIKQKLDVKKPRKILTIAEKKEKIQAARARLEAQEIKLAVNDLREYITNLKVPSVGDLFTVALTNRKDVKKSDVLRTLAAIGKVKVTITDKVSTTRKSKIETAS